MKQFMKTIGYLSFIFICYLAFKQVSVNGMFDTWKLNQYLNKNGVNVNYDAKR